MRGCRPLTEAEVRLVRQTFSEHASVRDWCLFELMLATGVRVSEALSLRVRDVVDLDYHPVGSVYFPRRAVKGRRQGFSVPLNDRAREAVLRQVEALRGRRLDRRSYLFRSRQGGNRAIDRDTALRSFRWVYSRLMLQGRVATHSCRKTFGMRMLNSLDFNLLDVSRAMRHLDPRSTLAYLEPGIDRIEAAILSQD